jgi:poly-beta-1,6-N-acetyl-D-glucosamine synthase
MLSVLFWIFLLLIFYTYAGYGLMIWIFLKIKRLLIRPRSGHDPEFLPPVTLIIAAYNEESFILQKIENTLEIDYPQEKFSIIVVTDGSVDNTPEIVKKFPRIHLLHEAVRGGKIAAINRAMTYVADPVVVFCDANTLLNPACLRKMVRHYINPEVGGVAGEKKIIPDQGGSTGGAGEGLYWKYESWLKKLDSDFFTVVGAAGELFSVRTSLFEPVEEDTLLDDFIISLRVCLKGYKVVYEPGAYAMEEASLTIQDEEKRKIRISAGGFQSIFRLKQLFNIFKHPLLSFQYFSHRLFRWIITPFCLPLLLFTNFLLVLLRHHPVYTFFLYGQLAFYILAAAGWISSRKNIKLPVAYIAYYFCFMNISLYKGCWRFITGTQSVLWEKAARKKNG